MIDRKKLKKQIDGLMKSYSSEEINGDTYFDKMMNLTRNAKKRK